MDIYALLSERFAKLTLVRNFSFARNTTIGCGGTAAVCAYPTGKEELTALISFLEKQKIAYCFLGAGANVLPAEGYYSGVVIRFSRMRRLVAKGERIIADAGVTGGELLRFARAHNIGGLEFLTGIPTTVGGATCGNAGVGEGHIGDLVLEVCGVEHGKMRVFSLTDCAFSEKKSAFQNGAAIAEVTLRGFSSSQEKIEARLAYFRDRRRHLPKGRSMGCVFVNPPEISAGKLIEDCGLKGFRLGGAYVAEEHANFVMNGGATALEISTLIEHIKRTVFERTGILLREEIRRLPVDYIQESTAENRI
ncbi:MAG: UDP-N-acetylmuramate dehydrogenase [Clostridia bacterium]|nr:UDP-N-acetylmuramate dehydrogenase [Clostridia bacterium]